MDNKKQLKIFCQNVKFLRKISDMSKEEMAEICGVKVETLIEIEKGIVPLETECEIIFKVAHHFKLKPHLLFQQIFLQTYEE